MTDDLIWYVGFVTIFAALFFGTVELLDFLIPRALRFLGAWGPFLRFLREYHKGKWREDDQN